MTRPRRWRSTCGARIERGPLDAWYVEDSGPLGLWRIWSDDVRGHAIDGGHFFPEETPGQTAEALDRFFGDADDRLV